MAISQEWRRAARHYRRLDEEGRELYWRDLSPEQQRFLADALSLRQRGWGRSLAIGCSGMFIGATLIILVQIAALVRGVQFVGNAMEDVSGATAATSTPSNREAPPVGCEDPIYAEINIMECNPGEYYRGWKRNREMNEADGRVP